MLSWKYTVPAFLVPFVFTAKSGGTAILLQGSAAEIVLVTATTMAGLILVAIGTGGYVRHRPATLVERGVAIAGGLAILVLA
jgi:TRAP-type uncharacterized transport system fused permease subunit